MTEPASRPAVGIASAAVRLPAASRSVRDVLADEGLPEPPPGFLDGRVPVAESETGSELALAAAREAMEAAGVSPQDVDVIVDYTVLPQEYLVPAWSMSNRLQHELGAKKAFTVGFSGGGSTNLHVAMHFASSLIRSDDSVSTALLLAADLAIPDNRVLGGDEPLAVLGDSAGAMILRRDAGRGRIVDVAMRSDGRMHDVCCIPGGAMAHPDRRDLFRLRLDRSAFEAAPRMESLRALADSVLARAGLRLSDVAFHVCPNLSSTDQADYARTLEVPEGRLWTSSLAGHGHLQATDLVLNYLSASRAGAFGEDDWVLMSSHGLGFLSGVCLIRN